MSRRFLTVAAAALVALALAGPAGADPSDDDIYGRLGVNEVAADYVVLVDTSASMQDQNRYGRVRTSLRALFAALAPDDQVTLVTFDDVPRQVWQGRIGDQPDAPLAKLPATATGGHTDIGRVLAQSVQILTRSGAPEIATVIMLTDGLHDPAAGSPYPLQAGYAWNKLRANAAAVRKTSLHAFAIPLTGATSAALMTKVYADRASILDIKSVDDLTSRLEQPKAGVRAAKAKTILGDDLTRSPTVTWSDRTALLSNGTGTVTATVRSGNQRLPLTVDNLKVIACPGVIATAEVKSVTLEPGQAAQIPVRLLWDAGPLSWKPFSTVDRDCPLRLTGTVGTPWASFLTTTLNARLALDLTAAAPMTLSADRGSWPRWSAGLGGLVVLLLLALALWWRRAHPVLAGTLIAESATGTRPIPLSGRRMTISAATAGVQGAGALRGIRRHSTVLLEITYSSDGSASRRATDTCQPAQATTIGGVRFEWRPATR